MATTTTENTVNDATRPQRLHIALWIGQGLLAAVFFATGLMKVTAPIDQLKTSMSWINGPLGPYVRAIGAVELLGVIGMILPAATRIQPVLTPLAAIGFAIVMALGSITHGNHGELSHIGANVVIGAIAVFVAWGRLKRAPITPR